MIKPLLQREKKYIQQQNQARAMAGLPLIKVRLRKCHTCACTFESTGNFYCKHCAAPKIQTLANYPIL